MPRPPASPSTFEARHPQLIVRPGWNTTGHDGNLWFTTRDDKIYKMTLQGAVPDPRQAGLPLGDRRLRPCKPRRGPTPDFGLDQSGHGPRRARRHIAAAAGAPARLGRRARGGGQPGPRSPTEWRRRLLVDPMLVAVEALSFGPLLSRPSSRLRCDWTNC